MKKQFLSILLFCAILMSFFPVSAAAEATALSSESATKFLSFLSGNAFYSPKEGDLYNREIISYSISLSPNLLQIREMLSGLFDKLLIQDQYFIQTKDGNISMPNTNDYSKNIT